MILRAGQEPVLNGGKLENKLEGLQWLGLKSSQLSTLTMDITEIGDLLLSTFRTLDILPREH